MSTLLIRHARLLTASSDLPDATVFIKDGRIEAIAASADLRAPRGIPELDASDLILAPGYIDLQLNGAFGHDFTADPTRIWEVAARLPQFGVTSFLPTVITAPTARIEAAQMVLQNERPLGFRGAEPLGLHIEGPYLNPEKRGAHNPAYLQSPDDKAVAGWSPATGVRLVTLAPELPGATAVIGELASRGVVVSAGHSMATFTEAQAGFAAGVRYGTHLFNAMPVLGHREPGLAGALLTHDGSVTGIIPDGIHVHPAMVNLAWRAKGADGLNVVSDAMGALGVAPGTYMLNDFEVTVSASEARLEDGRLAGSVLPIDQAVRNLVAYTGCTAIEAITTATRTPARVLAIDRERGDVAPGFIADLVLLDNALQVVQTIAAGELVYPLEE